MKKYYMLMLVILMTPLELDAQIWRYPDCIWQGPSLFYPIPYRDTASEMLFYFELQRLRGERHQLQIHEMLMRQLEIDQTEKLLKRLRQSERSRTGIDWSKILPWIIDPKQPIQK